MLVLEIIFLRFLWSLVYSVHSAFPNKEQRTVAIALAEHPVGIAQHPVREHPL